MRQRLTEAGHPLATVCADFHHLPLAQASIDVRVDQLRHQRHIFCFDNSDHLAAYLATSPKYALPDELTDNPDRLAVHLRQVTPERPITATSTVTYAVATRP